MTAATRPAAGHVRVAATMASAVYVGYAGLQLALAAGAPLGEHVWGGRYDEVLPPTMRVVAIGAAGALVGMATVVATRAGLVGGPARGHRSLVPATWSIAGYMALNTVGNLASTSRIEQLVSAPLTAIASVCTVVVARS